MKNGEKVKSQRDRHFCFKEKIFGQFFTPIEVADFIVQFASLHILNRQSACDPACGDGIFLSSMLKYGFNEIIGIDIDEKVIKSIDSELRAKTKVIIGNTLIRKTLNNNGLLPENYFDLVAGNPPFSAKYGRIEDRGILSFYKFGSGVQSQAIEILFLERFIQLAKKGGIVGIILPDGIFLNTNYRRIRDFILKNCKVLAVISLPRGIFNSSKSTTSKTSVLFALKGEMHDNKVFIAEIEDLDELNGILELYKKKETNLNVSWVDITSETFSPKSYLMKQNIPKFKEPCFKLRDVIDEMFCGSTEYGSKRKFSKRGIPFISAKIVTPFGIDFSRDARFVEHYSIMDKKKAHTQVGDVLFVRVGVGCSGRASVVTDEMDLGIADDWIYVIKVRKERISPYYLTIFLQSKYGRTQTDYAKRGVGTVTIPQKLLREIEIPVLPVQSQLRLEKAYREMVSSRRKGFYEKANEIYQNMIKEVEMDIENARIRKD